MLVPVVLSGGNGSRLWPISREAHPKPFIRLNNDPYSLLQQTYQRIANIPNVKHILTVTNIEYYYQSKKELSDLTFSNLPNFSFILEPLSRNTAAAIIFSALFSQALISSDAILLILPADHIISNQAKFNLNIEKAYQLAKKEVLTTFGIIPNKVETAYGYIQYEQSKDLNATNFKVLNFYEKPLFEEAQSFIEQGNYLWNSGIFCFSVNTFLQAIKHHKPELYENVVNCWKISTRIKKKSETKIKLDKESFFKLENISIDYALMEKAKNITVLPADFGWSDIGSWDALNNLLEPTQNGNRIVGQACLLETHNTTIYNPNSPGRTIAVLGVKNLMIVDTSDALLICEQSYVQKVKQLVEELKLNGYESYRYHQTVYRPWGHYTILDQGPNYKLKRLLVHPGASLSLQMHEYRSEYWVVVAGIATVENGSKKILLKEKESTFIAIGNKHCLSNAHNQDLLLIELQLGNYLGEDDIIRFKDKYDREDSSQSENKIYI